MDINDAHYEETAAFWSRRTGQPVSAEGAREIVSNVAGFFRVLAEWDRKAREQHAQIAPKKGTDG